MVYYKQIDNKYMPKWALTYFTNHCYGKKNIDSTNKYLANYTVECVRDIIYKYFELVGKRELTKKRKDKIAWLCYCNFNHDKYCKFIDLNFAKFFEKGIEI